MSRRLTPSEAGAEVADMAIALTRADSMHKRGASLPTLLAEGAADGCERRLTEGGYGGVANVARIDSMLRGLGL